MIDIYCIGSQCSVKNQCRRYTDANTVEGVGLERFMRKCTNQKMFVQNEEAIIKGR